VPGRSANVERQRHHYLPDDNDVRVLFIGESPPAGETFFYHANSNLHHATREAFETAIPALRQEADFRDAFMRLGCYLEDLSVRPVNGLPGPERRQACKDSVKPLARRIRDLSPRVVLVVGITVSGLVGQALERAGLGEVERKVVPFPTTRVRRTDHVPYRQAYVDELSALVRRWRRRRLLAS
jgi:uracil-DNA glycosylase